MIAMGGVRSGAAAAGSRLFVTTAATPTTETTTIRQGSLVLWRSQHLLRSRDVAFRLLRGQERQCHWNVVVSTERVGRLFSSYSRNQSTTVFNNVVHAAVTNSNSNSKKEEEKEQKEERVQDKTTEAQDGTSMAAASSTNPNDKDGDGEKTRAERLAKASRVVAQRGGTIAKKGVFGARNLIQKYGTTFVATYASLWFLTLSGVFCGLSSGVLDPTTIISYMGGTAAAAASDGGEAAAAAASAAAASEDAATAATTTPTSEEDAKSTVQFVAGYLRKFSFTAPYAEAVEKNPYVANLAIAWITTKILEPVRFAIAIAIVPRIARAIGAAPKEDVEGEAKEGEEAQEEEEGAAQKEENAIGEESSTEKFVVEETKKQ